ncbi:MAG TPA: serine/threonine-protein kinase, partial [Phycisphaerales bacterium]|nr:serine/threonine-protein kinase [Phycisphaerales bacterium]
MTPQQYERVSEIFHHALDLPPADREAFIASACAGDAEIRTAVIAMLAQHNSPAMDLDNPALGSNINLSAFITADTQSSAPLPATIGPFKIKSVLGEGGMSIVYRAHQSFPARDVAVKVLRHSIVSPAALRRFHGEVQALARMTHPNIAQIYDAGTFNDGQTDRPYFAMELVDGLPIAEYARQHNLTTAQSLQLIISVCHAVQHAHLRGIIHRDLKSSNILVTADGTPKILDFG